MRAYIPYKGLMSLLLAILLLTGCFGGETGVDTTKEQPVRAPITDPSAEDALTLVPIWDGFESPVGLVTAAGIEDKLYVIEQDGRILELDRKSPQQAAKLVLDLTERVYNEGSEQGLLGLAFHPSYPDNDYAYVNYTTKQGTVIARYTFKEGQGDPDSELVLLSYDQPYSNHNGGQLAFGPDGLLYIASGDGGSRGDPNNNAQESSSLLGKILRIDVDAADPKPEIYAYGLRNPWRFSFDPETGELWAADVGQNKLEEINLITEGGNYGWRLKEASACYEPAEGCETGELIDPIWEYPRSEGQSITGGYVYRGQIAELQGRYLYGDFASGKIWALRREQGGQVENRLLMESGLPIASFGVDQEQELYVVAYDGTIYQLRK